MALPPAGVPGPEGSNRPSSGSGTPGPPVVPAMLRAVLYLLFIVILLAVGMNAALSIVAPEAADAIKDDPSYTLGLGQTLAVQALLLPLVLLGTAFFVRRVDHRSLSWIGMSMTPAARRGIVLVTIVAAAAPLVWLMLVAIAADVRLLGMVPATDALPFGRLVLFLGGFAIAALAEEIMLRGYVFTVLEGRYGFINAAGSSAALFALLHGGNPAVGPVAMINTFLLGLLFGALRFRTGSIVPCTVAHATWNVMVACVLSLPLSGIDSPHIFAVEVSGNAYATGGGYGPEASLILTGILVPLVFVAVLWAGDEATGDEATGDEETGDEDAEAPARGDGDD